MSKHIGRKDRWTWDDAKTYSSALGKVVYQEDGWYAVLDYRTLVTAGKPGEPVQWESRHRRLGPFRRPRNAMVALEEEATALKNRHGKHVLFGDQLGAEA